MPTGNVVILPSGFSRYILNFDTWRKKWEAMAWLDSDPITGFNIEAKVYKGWGATIELANMELHKSIKEGRNLGSYEKGTSTKEGKGYRAIEKARENKQKQLPNLEDLF